MKIVSQNIENLENFKDHKLYSKYINLFARYKFDNFKKAKRCGECGNYLIFGKYVNIETGEMTKKLELGNFCHNRWCPYCAYMKVRKLAKEAKSILSQIESNHKNVSYIFLTLTIKNPPLNKLREAAELMSKAFNNMFKKENLYSRHILGYLRAIEFMGDNTPKGEAHPHYHCIIAVDNSYFNGRNYLNQKAWTELWQKYLKVDYTPIVDVRKITAKNEKWSESDSAVFETIKYSVAPQIFKKLSDEEFLELDKQTFRLRQYNKGGVFKEYKPIETEDDLLCELVDLIYYSWQNEDYENKPDIIASLPRYLQKEVMKLATRIRTEKIMPA